MTQESRTQPTEEPTAQGSQELSDIELDQVAGSGGGLGVNPSYASDWPPPPMR
jgi:hypothetical protein